MGRPTSIRIFVADGSPDGIRVARSRTGQATPWLRVGRSCRMRSNVTSCLAQALQLPVLLDQLREHAPDVDLEAPDRGNDPLRKAKYLATHQPPYFSLVAIGGRRDFSVTYTEGGFRLREDLVPYA